MNEDMLQPAGGRSNSKSRLTCSQCERMVLDAIDGSLLGEDRTQFDLHIAGCAACTRAMADAQRGSAWLEMLRAAPPEPPVLLLDQILARTSGDPAMAIPLRPRESIFAYAGGGLQQAVAGGGFGGAPGGVSGGAMGGSLPFAAARQRNWFARLAHAVAQPRFAMTTAMAFFSVALTMNLTGVRLSDLHASSLKPSSLRHGFWSANAKMFRYYDNLRVVYEMESRVRQLQQQSDEQDNGRQPSTQPKGDAKPADNAPKKQGAGHSSLPAERQPRSRALRNTQSGMELALLRPEGLKKDRFTGTAASICGEGVQL